MSVRRQPVVLLALAVTILALVISPMPAGATHSWDGYHWARTANPFTVKVVDSVTARWDNRLTTAISDWSRSSVMDVVRRAGSTDPTVRRQCRPLSGRVHVCNSTYGSTGWLGVAQVWVYGEHIAQATTKLNDSYLASTHYNGTNRQHVICQEIGHTWGLDHQSTSGADLNTCMDYSRNLDNPHPNGHDYRELETIYSHSDGDTSLAAAPAGFLNADVSARENWGRLASASADGRSALYVRDFGQGYQILTEVMWAR
jgi:hypothetical protein